MYDLIFGQMIFCYKTKIQIASYKLQNNMSKPIY